MIILGLLLALTHIDVAKLSGVVSPASAGYIVRSIQKAESDGAECLIIELDTPGGLDEAMRTITKSVLNASVPVIIYVHPSGARCASAGVFIVYSSHAAAMTPGTNIGAAHPVSMGGKMDQSMEEKVVNDAVAYIKSLAQKTGRNIEWAEDVVRKSVSVTAEEALKLNVIDLIAEDLPELLQKLDNREVKVLSETLVLHTKGQETREVGWSFKETFLSRIANPTIAYILLMIGLWGIILEFSHPGAIFPGVFGGISLLLAFYALQILPVSFVGIGLIILAFGLFIMEALTPTYGPFALGGAASLALGSIMLIRTEASFLQISRPAIIIVVVATTSFFVFALSMAFKAMRKKPTTGRKGLIEEEGEVRMQIEPGKEGRVFILGELWKAKADEVIKVGEKVKVKDVKRLVLYVERTTEKEE